MKDIVLIPMERVAPLIGKNGETRKWLEEKTGVKIRVDSIGGEVEILSKDACLVWRVKDVIRAIGRGFSPHNAISIIEDDDTVLEVIDLKDIIGSSENDLERLRGRIIGKGGRIKALIEGCLKVMVSIYGKTISIIGRMDNVKRAKEAIAMIIDGKPHSAVTRYLEKQAKIIREEDMTIKSSGKEEQKP